MLNVDGWTDGRTDGRTYGRTDERTDERTNGRKLARLCLPAKAGATKMGTQQQHNNQDRYVNELVPPRTWVQSGVLPKKFGHKLFLSLSAQLHNV